jgi:hypothetical protein
MSKQFKIALAIWIRALIIDGVITSILFSVSKEIGFALSGLVIIGIGGILTVPLLIIIIPLVKLSVQIPYSLGACKAWLAFLLMGVAALFLFFLSTLFSLDYGESMWLILNISTVVSVAIATSTTNNNYRKLKEEFYEHQLV